MTQKLGEVPVIPDTLIQSEYRIGLQLHIIGTSTRPIERRGASFARSETIIFLAPREPQETPEGLNAAAARLGQLLDVHFSIPSSEYKGIVSFPQVNYQSTILPRDDDPRTKHITTAIVFPDQALGQLVLDAREKRSAFSLQTANIITTAWQWIPQRILKEIHQHPQKEHLALYLAWFAKFEKQ